MAITEAEFAAAVGRMDVFTRTAPDHELRVVQTLELRGRVAAMTGDGVYDAPDLKPVDGGSAMGIKGTEAAKKAAQMVLTDDDFASVVAEVQDNIRKVIARRMPTNDGEALAVTFAILCGFAMPMRPVQILRINLILAGRLGLVLAFAPPQPGRDALRAGEGLLSPSLIWRIVFVSGHCAVFSLGPFFWAQGQARDPETARTMVVNLLVVPGVFCLFSVRYLRITSFTPTGVKGTGPVLAGDLRLSPAEFRRGRSDPGPGMMSLVILEIEGTFCDIALADPGREMSI
ncbi:cation transporting ATPase C-terminal domain-containing protein [Paracoccus sp. IB05]|uniref:cation transporting ATPase C-terminal domain-containing protein n=1 Tax=Paracoccus sp. IB05 TaxID=2779367 RepID=UPI0018E8602A|nr:cation transporting ATPase C-terminal domain-containing protein [Paracoccus sp. IB05]MBJ2152275.1 cation transporting ATPase C-terminal domain-containing protein [Paracoccus sp. IB05]